MGERRWREASDGEWTERARRLFGCGELTAPFAGGEGEGRCGVGA